MAFLPAAFAVNLA
jgi:AhpD family alkylhydroperoxidase